MITQFHGETYKWTDLNAYKLGIGRMYKENIEFSF